MLLLMQCSWVNAFHMHAFPWASTRFRCLLFPPQASSCFFLLLLALPVAIDELKHKRAPSPKGRCALCNNEIDANPFPWPRNWFMQVGYKHTWETDYVATPLHHRAANLLATHNLEANDSNCAAHTGLRLLAGGTAWPCQLLSVLLYTTSSPKLATQP